MTFVSRNTRFNRHFWVCYQALNTFNDVCKQHRKPREMGVFFLFSVVLQTSFHQQQIPADFGSGESRLWGRWIPCRLILTEIALTRSIAVLLTAIFRNPKMPLFIESTHFPNQSVEGRLCLKHIHTPSVETFITQKCW